jgi:hypothetical protein
VAERLAELDQRLGGLGELLVAYRAQSVIGKDLDRAREQLEEALAAQIEALRAELAAAHDELAARVEANGSGTAALRTLWRRHQSSSRS